jgi:hypothetical protein
MSTSKTPFVIQPGMFAIKRDEAPHLIVYPEDGSRPLKSPEALDAWAKLYALQTEEIRQSAISASMFGWDSAAAIPALIWIAGDPARIKPTETPS